MIIKREKNKLVPVGRHAVHGVTMCYKYAMINVSVK